MLIRVKGYNSGIKEYLEEGNKAGREYSRDELDERVILDGDLDLTHKIYHSIPDNGQERYITFTLSFAEDEVSKETLQAVTKEFKQFLMTPYRDNEFNFYAEAHFPRLKEIKNKKTGEMEVRKPHIHVVVPRKNLLSGLEMNPRGTYETNQDYFEAFQEYINQKYELISPRERIRVDPQDAGSILSRYKGDDFRGKNRAFKQELVQQVIERGVDTREGFYALVGEHGETRIRNQGKDTEYIAVKLPGDAKFTNLKETIFQDDFILRRELKKPPLDKTVIRERLLAWPQRAKEIKYVSKATPSLRKQYKEASPEQKRVLLVQREQTFYARYGGSDDGIHTRQRKGNKQRGSAQAERGRISRSSAGVQNLSGGDVANDGQSRQAGVSDSTVLLPGDASIHMGQSQPGGDSGLRPVVRAGRGGRTGGRRGHRTSALSAGAAGAGKRGDGKRDGGEWDRFNRYGQRWELRLPAGIKTKHPIIPPWMGKNGGVRTSEEVQERAERLFGPSRRDTPHALKIRLPRVFLQKAKNKPDARRSASTVAGYFLCKHQENQILPATRRALWRIDLRFHETRRALYADDRLSRKEKQQLLAVMAFERMKAKQRIEQPKSANPQVEDTSMGSKEIRALLSANDDTPENSISGGSTAPARERMRQLMERMKQSMDTETQRKRARELSAKDLYTRRAKFSQNVHYLDKHTDKTLFVDSGKAITLRREALSESAVTVALELARERFGSTLTIKGSAEFKQLVVEAVAKNGLDVHFTDKAMNQMLAERRAEIEAEREGATITAASQTQPESAGPEQASTQTRTEVDDPSLIKGVLLDHGDAPYKHDPKQNMSYYVRLMTEAGEKVYWGVGLKDAMEAENFRLGQALRLKDLGTQPVTVRVRDERTGQEVERIAHRREWVAEPLDRSPAAESARETRVMAVPPTIVVEAEQVMGSAILAREARWERNSGLSMAEVGTTPAMMGMRAEEHAVQILFGEDASEAGRALVTSLMEHEAYRATFQQVVQARSENLNPVLRNELLASAGYALAQSLIEQGEQHYGAVPDAVRETQKSQLEDQERQRQETSWIDVDAAIAAIEAQDRAYEARMENAEEAERQSALTPKERTAEQQASPEALLALREKHDKNVVRRALDKEFRQWSKEQEKSDPGFAELSAKEKRAAFSAQHVAPSRESEATDKAVETVVQVEIEQDEDGMQMG